MSVDIKAILRDHHSVLCVAKNAKESHAIAASLRKQLRISGDGKKPSLRIDLEWSQDNYKGRLFVRVWNDKENIERILQTYHQGALLWRYDKLDWELLNLAEVRGFCRIELIAPSPSTILQS